MNDVVSHVWIVRDAGTGWLQSVHLTWRKAFDEALDASRFSGKRRWVHRELVY